MRSLPGKTSVNGRKNSSGSSGSNPSTPKNFAGNENRLGKQAVAASHEAIYESVRSKDMQYLTLPDRFDQNQTLK